MRKPAIAKKIANPTPDPRKPVVKFYCHLACLLLAIFILYILPALNLGDGGTAVLTVIPNVAQEIIDRLRRL